MRHGRLPVELLKGRDTRDKFGRLLAYIHLDDGTMLNRHLVEHGFAYADPRFPHPLKDEFLTLQERARSGSRGLWAGAKTSDLPDYLRKKIPVQK